MLRYALVQDWDLDDDGRPETLRLLFATPRRWLSDGQSIKVEHAPTAFGCVSVRVQSRLSRGEVITELEMPQHQPPPQTLLRIRVPEGWHVKSAQAGVQELDSDAQGTVDVSGIKGKSTVRFRVERL